MLPYLKFLGLMKVNYNKASCRAKVIYSDNSIYITIALFDCNYLI